MGGRVLLSQDEGTNWQDTGLENTIRLRLFGDTLLMAVTPSQIYTRKNAPEEWIGFGPVDHAFHDIAATGYGFYVVTDRSVLFSDSGDSWADIWSDSNATCPPAAIASNNSDEIFVGTSGCGSFGYESEVLRWNGSEWNREFAAGGTFRDFLFLEDGTAFAASRDEWMYADGGLFRKAAGEPWERIRSGTHFALETGPGGTIYAGTPYGVIESHDNGSTWTDLGPPLPVRAVLAEEEGIRFAATFSYSEPVIDYPILTPGMGLMDFSDGVWRAVDTGYSASNVQALASTRGGSVLAGSIGGLWESFDRGMSWMPRNTYLHGLRDPYVTYPFGAHAWNPEVVEAPWGDMYVLSNEFAFLARLYRLASSDSLFEHLEVEHDRTRYLTHIRATGDSVLIAAGEEGLFRSPDRGETWARVDSSTSFRTLSLTQGGVLLAGSDTGEILRSIDTGITWSAASLPSGTAGISAMSAPYRSTGFAVAGTELLRSDDGGASWATDGESPPGAVIIQVNSEEDVFVLAERGKIWMREAGSPQWTDITGSVPRSEAQAILLDEEGYLYAATNGSGVYRSAEPTVLSVEPHQRDSFPLESYPNPFTSEVTFRFTPSVPIRIQITIYDLLGRRVSEQVDRIFSAGEHRWTFDGSTLPPGLYFARIQNGSETQTIPIVRTK